MILKWKLFLLFSVLVYVLPSLCFSLNVKNLKSTAISNAKSKAVEKVKEKKKESEEQSKDKASSDNSKRGQISLMIYGGVGYTLKTGIDGISNQNIDVKSGEKINYNYGVQICYELGKVFNVGGDIGYTSVFGNDSYNYDILYVLLLGEFKLFDSFYIQLGIGPYIGIGDQKGAPFGIMLAAGYDINIADFLAIPILLRSDYIFDDEAVIPISLKVGLKFKF